MRDTLFVLLTLACCAGEYAMLATLFIQRWFH
jgi:hypothetical protein